MTDEYTIICSSGAIAFAGGERQRPQPYEWDGLWKLCLNWKELNYVYELPTLSLQETLRRHDEVFKNKH